MYRVAGMREHGHFRAMEAQHPLYEPDFYRARYAALSLAEVMRFSSWWQVPIVYLTKGFIESGDLDFLPGRDADVQAPESELSSEARDAINVYRPRFEALGYRAARFHMVRKTLNAQFRNAGGYIGVAADGLSAAFISYVRTQPPAGPEKRHTSLAVVGYLPGDHSFAVINNLVYLDPIPGSRVVRLNSDDPATLVEAFQKEVRRHQPPLVSMPDSARLAELMDRNADAIHRYRVEVRRLYVRATPAEIAAAERRMPAPPLPR